MKIAHILNYLPSYHKIWGGAEQAALRNIEMFLNHGHETLICTLPHTVEGKIEGVKSYTLPNNDGFQIVLNNQYYQNTYDTLLDILKKEKPDLCHFYNIDKLSMSVVQTVQELKIPSIISIYDYWYFCSKKILINSHTQRECHLFNSSSCIPCVKKDFRFIGKLAFSLYAFKSKLLNRSKFDQLIQYCSKINVLSNNSKNIALEYGIPEDKMVVLPSYFEMSEIKSENKVVRDKNHIIFSGWLLPHKGFHIIIEALSQLVETNPNVKITILGEKGGNSKYHYKIMNRIKELNLEKYLDFKGKVSFHELTDYYRKGSCLVIPEQWLNMGPVSIFEAMTYKIPVIASKIGGIPEMVIDGETGFLAQHDSPEDWVKKIKFVLENENRMDEITNKAYEFAKSYCDKEKYYKTMLNAYEEIIGLRRS